MVQQVMGSKSNLANQDLNIVRSKTTSGGLLTRNLTVVAKNPLDNYFYFGKIYCLLYIAQGIVSDYYTVLDVIGVRYKKSNMGICPRKELV